MSALQTIAFQNLDFVTPAAEVAPFSLGDVSGLTVGLPPRQAAVKRVTDVALASLALLLLGVPMVVVAAVMWLQGDGPALFRQQRIGLHNRPFTMLNSAPCAPARRTRRGCAGRRRGMIRA